MCGSYICSTAVVTTVDQWQCCTVRGCSDVEWEEFRWRYCSDKFRFVSLYILTLTTGNSTKGLCWGILSFIIFQCYLDVYWASCWLNVNTSEILYELIKSIYCLLDIRHCDSKLSKWAYKWTGMGLSLSLISTGRRAAEHVAPSSGRSRNFVESLLNSHLSF